MSNLIKNVGFIGTGLMGLPMAKNILAKKFKLIPLTTLLFV